MADKVLPISSVEFDPTNPRQRTERSATMIRSSLEQFGALRSLVGQRLPDGRIVVRAGNGTLEQAGQVGIDKVRVIERRSDELVIVVADDLDESQWKSYSVADNRSSDLSGWDIETLQDYADDPDIKVGDWFTEGEIKAWDLEKGDGDYANPDELWDGMPEFDQPDASAPYSVKVNFFTFEALEDFSRLIGQKVTEKTKSVYHPQIEKEDLLKYQCKSDES